MTLLVYLMILDLAMHEKSEKSFGPYTGTNRANDSIFKFLD